MRNLIEDVSKLTTIPDKTLIRLNKKYAYCICDAVVEDIIKENDITEADIGIGTLYIKHVNGEIKYRFVPCESLEKGVIQAVVNKENMLENTLTEALAKKFQDIYKDLC